MKRLLILLFMPLVFQGQPTNQAADIQISVSYSITTKPINCDKIIITPPVVTKLQ